MIQLHSDCLVFEMSGGDKIPCSVEKLTIEILADSLDQVDPEVIRQAATAVLHYFRDDLGREVVTVDEFTAALEQVLTGLGFQIDGSSVVPSAKSDTPTTAETTTVADVDLIAMAESLGDALELGFFSRLRDELRTRLAAAPRMVRFTGLRACAKRIARVNRWCPRSLQVSDEIVGFLRDCWGAERPQQNCSLLVN
ncbi:MAG: hypothetical protein JNK85_09605 [Verrucomicrobiales bacterium]|nr:hypothetical protein [Verrucomicrobiales bacterium]